MLAPGASMTDLATLLAERQEFLNILTAIARLWGNSTDDEPQVLSCATAAKLATRMAREGIANVQGGGTATARQALWLERVEDAYKEGFTDATRIWSGFDDTSISNTFIDRAFKASKSSLFATVALAAERQAS